MPSIRHLILVPALAALALPGGAHAATLTPLKPCFVSVDQATREPVPVNASGFTPNASVDVAIDGVPVKSNVAVLIDGTVSGSVTGPFQKSGQRRFMLTVTEEGNPQNTASVMSKVTALSLRVKPKQAPPRKRVRFIGRGFTTGETVYGHYVFGGKLRKTISFGVPQGDCGVIDVKRRQIPVKRPRTGRWTLQADTEHTYSRQPQSVFVRLAITVKRVLSGG